MRKVMSDQERSAINTYINPFTQEIAVLLPYGLTIAWRDLVLAREWCEVFMARTVKLHQDLPESSVGNTPTEVDAFITAFGPVEDLYVLCANLLYQISQLEDYVVRVDANHHLHSEDLYLQAIKEWDCIQEPTADIIAMN